MTKEERSLLGKQAHDPELRLAKRELLDAETLKQYLTYWSHEGVLTWNVSRGSAAAGREAGSLNGDGYVHVMLFGKNWRVQNLAMLYMTGKWWPLDLEVDHKDRDKTNNAWLNLHLVTRSENMQNKDLRADNTSGFRGVTYEKRRAHLPDPWRARIFHLGRTHHLGYFCTKTEAIAARLAAEKRFGWIIT